MGVPIVMDGSGYLTRGRKVAAIIGDDWRKWKEIKDYQPLYHMDENLVPEYTLPSPLDKADGTCVASAFEWMNFQRPEILKLYQNEMFGEMIPRPDGMRFELLSSKDDALNGTALRREVRIHCFMNNGKKFSFDLLMYAPKSALEKPVPAFAGLNFKGNHGCTAERDVRPTPAAFDNGFKMVSPVNEETFFAEENWGIQKERWCFEEAVARGYASVTVCYEDIFPDRVNGWEDSCLSLFGDFEGYEGNHPRYSAIGAWTWGLARIMDYLESCPLIDASRVGVHGHSRLGKTALWTGATDPRYKMVVSNDSGCGGAAVFRRMFGENWLIITNVFPHWFVSGSRKYIMNEAQMPFDQHFLVSLCAPRSVVISSATEDLWADPKGEFLAAYHAGAVYALFGSSGLPCEQWPEPEVCVTGDISYHLRVGTHNQTPFDWMHFFDVADRCLK